MPNRTDIDRYHHGDLRAACIESAISLLDEGGESTLSLRAVARRAGVSANAPYRHFRDKNALLAALATHGFHELGRLMKEADNSADPGEEFLALGQSYVRYALDHPGIFRLMYGHPCSRYDAEANAAAAESAQVLANRVSQLVPEESRQALLIGSWALVHGLASLILDGKITSGGPEEVDDLVRVTVRTILERQPMNEIS
ncbi:TetR/AcrR family transcriptional regulator [Streptomyces sp. NPDC087420]|uniref:TetR/AcrR family transcriptional regulator n=1 Tax=Streptomyces sp. NPDC087420 TaxID=3365785 RepID=UPI003833D1C9